MRRFAHALALAGLLLVPRAADAGFTVYTQSTAAQTLVSPLFDPLGMVTIVASGPQQIFVDPVTGVASVQSQFSGTDFPTPFGFAGYDLYNTTFAGTVAPDGLGGFDISFSLLFELAITEGPLAGVVFKTLTDSLFATNVPALPFGAGTVFADPARPADATAIFLKADPNGVFAGFGLSVGDLVGASLNRTVEVTAVTPVPATAVAFALGGGLLALRRRLLVRA